MADEAPDLTLFLGDYIYEYTRTGARAANVVRHYGFEDATTLAGYRNRYALHRTDADLQRLHAAAPCLVVWDDHEVLDNYSGVWPDKGGRPDDFLMRRAAGYQAFYEAMPIRRTRLDQRLQMPIYKRVRYGRLAEFFMLDGRQYRSRGACVDEGGAKGQIVTDAQCLDRVDPSRTFLGFRAGALAVRRPGGRRGALEHPGPGPGHGRSAVREPERRDPLLDRHLGRFPRRARPHDPGAAYDQATQSGGAGRRLSFVLDQ